MKLLIFTLSLASAMGFKDYNMKLEGRKVQKHDNCVDISHYEDVEYNVTATKMCQYKQRTHCESQRREVCREVPVTQCSIVGYTQCTETPNTQIVADDLIENESFFQQHCWPVIKVVKEIKKVPHCEYVSKQQCDSKWEINEFGEKVFKSNENCHPVTWEDCKLVDKEVEQEVESYECQPSGMPIMYHKVVPGLQEVTTVKRVCEPRAESVCEVRTEEQCGTVEWEECRDTVMPSCFDATFRIPSQEYNHLLRCTVDH